MIIENLFPIPVTKFKLRRSISLSEINFLNTTPFKPNIGNLLSVNQNVLRSKELNSLKEFIEKSLKKYVEEIINPSFDTGLKITQSWFNINKKNNFHHRHYHPNSLLSGVFYLKADSKLDRIVFYRDPSKDLPFTFDIKSKQSNPWNTQGWYLPVESGDLIIFPSSLFHGVEAIDTDRERVSLSFNTFSFGCIGSNENLSYVEIKKESE